MNIFIVTQEDVFYLPYFFKTFFNLINKSEIDVTIKGVIIQNSLGKKSKLKLIIQMINFYGLLLFTFQTFKYIAKKIINKMFLYNLLPKAFSIEYFFKKNNISIKKNLNINSIVFREYIINDKIDLIISVAASQIFKSKILNTPRFGCINIHNAPIPSYRGMLPNFWQMLNDEKYSIMTIHEMNEKLDKGRIIYQYKTEIEKGMSLDKLIILTKIKNAIALVKILKMFLSKQVKYKNLPQVKGSYFSFPTKEDVLKFKRKGYKII